MSIRKPVFLESNPKSAGPKYNKNWALNRIDVRDTMLTCEEFFNNYPKSKRLFIAILAQLDQIGPAEMRVTKSQIAFRRKRAFAWLWIPARYLRGKTAPLVLSLSFLCRDLSPRWKEIVTPYPGRYMHHLELYSPSEIDDEVRLWLKFAWDQAG